MEKEKKDSHTEEHIDHGEERVSPHSIYALTEKYLLVVLSGCIAIWSSCATPIYYPALQILKQEFNISEEQVNISVVVYQLFQGFSPTVFGGLADVYGRRPILIMCMVIFIVASIVIARTDSYAILLVFRIIQASGISPSVAISAGIVGDITVSQERGGFIGIQSGLTLLGQAFGSLIGAALISGFSWRAIFWFLTIGSGAVLLFMSFLLPETKRALVGNGSVIPRSFMNRAPILYIPKIRNKWHLMNPDTETLEPPKKPDYLTPFKIMIFPEISIVLLNGAIHYALWTMLLTTLTHQLTVDYGYDTMRVGLCYLPAGFAGLIGAVTSGRVLDWVYRNRHRKYKAKVEAGTIEKEIPFNIVKCRVLVIFPYAFFTDGFAIMFGWCLYKKIHIASILVSEFFVCTGCIAMIGINTTLLVDLFPSHSSAATSSVNFTRCILGAVFVAALTSMNNSLTVGGTFTLMSALGVISTLSLMIPMKYGMKWSVERASQNKIIE
jgi:MFS family permease